MSTPRRSARWRTERVRAAGINLRVARRGSGPALLLLTGIGANLEMWRPFERLVRDREVIALDAPGTGLSDRPRYPLRMWGLAHVVVALLDALKLAQVDVLGYSFGGLLAQELAHREPAQRQADGPHDARRAASRGRRGRPPAPARRA